MVQSLLAVNKFSGHITTKVMDILFIFQIAK